MAQNEVLSVSPPRCPRHGTPGFQCQRLKFRRGIAGRLWRIRNWQTRLNLVKRRYLALMQPRKLTPDQIFEEALQITDSHQRAAYLKEAAEDDGQLLQRVEAL